MGINHIKTVNASQTNEQNNQVGHQVQFKKKRFKQIETNYKKLNSIQLDTIRYGTICSINKKKR